MRERARMNSIYVLIYEPFIYFYIKAAIKPDKNFYVKSVKTVLYMENN